MMSGSLSDKVGIAALVPAAGYGERLGRGPKAFLPIGDRPVVSWVVEKMKRVASEVVVAVPSDFIDEARVLLKDCKLIIGGSTRQETVELLAQASGQDLLLLHDASRPFCSIQLLQRVCLAARQHGAAGAFLPARVPAGLVTDEGWLTEAYPSARLVCFQGPQAFRKEVLTNILASATSAGLVCQSTVELALAAGQRLKFVEGEVHNIKITTDADWAFAQRLKQYLG